MKFIDFIKGIKKDPEKDNLQDLFSKAEEKFSTGKGSRNKGSKPDKQFLSPISKSAVNHIFSALNMKGKNYERGNVEVLITIEAGKITENMTFQETSHISYDDLRVIIDDVLKDKEFFSQHEFLYEYQKEEQGSFQLIIHNKGARS